MAWRSILHGAMVTEEIEDAEADLISSVREIVGSRPYCRDIRSSREHHPRHRAAPGRDHRIRHLSAR